MTEKEIITIATQIAVGVCVDKLAELIDKNKKQSKDDKLHNTKLLLKNYRRLNEYNNSAIYDIAEQCKDGMDDLLILMGAESDDKEASVRAIKDGVIKTRTIMRHVNSALCRYQEECEGSSKPEMQRRWRELYPYYLSPERERMTASEIAEAEHISEATVYLDLNLICNDLSVLFFGIDALDLFINPLEKD